MSMTFETLRQANVLRSIETFKREPCRENMIAFALGVGEESGEVLGAVRALMGITKRKSGFTEQDVSDEVADTLFYGDLVVACAGEALEDALQRKYNKVSERSGSPYRLVNGVLIRKVGP